VITPGKFRRCARLARPPCGLEVSLSGCYLERSLLPVVIGINSWYRASSRFQPVVAMYQPRMTACTLQDSPND
jgi:hypothetical protein